MGQSTSWGAAQYMCTEHSMARQLISLVLACLVSLGISQSLEGLVQLDRTSFDKIVTKFEYSLIKFDIGFPAPGDKHKNFGKVATQIGEVDNLFLGEVRIKNYGDKTNQDIADRFNVKKDEISLPETILFTTKDGALAEMARYGGDYSVNNLRLFLSSKSGVYLKLDGCIKEMDTLAEKFSRATNKEDREKILFAAESWAREKGEDAMVYVKIMKASLDTGHEGVEKEMARVEKVMDNKASDKVIVKMARKLNVLNSFYVRDEL